MTLRLGDTAPDFTAESTEGTIHFHDWLGGQWGVLFSHPADFTPVCTTELGAASRLHHEFARRGVRIAAISVDPLDSHLGWISDINETQRTTVGFPIIADPDARIATLYDMIHPRESSTHTVRSVFVIGPDRTIRLTLTYPASTGRSFTEILRVIDSLQLTSKHPVATPVDWVSGEDCIVAPTLANAEIPGRLPKGFTEVRPYLRYTPHPDPDGR